MIILSIKKTCLWYLPAFYKENVMVYSVVEMHKSTFLLMFLIIIKNGY